MKTIRLMNGGIVWIVMLLAASFMTSCDRTEDTPEVKSAAMKVNVSLTPEYAKAPLGKVTIVLRNVSTGKESTATSEKGLPVEFKQLPVDIYDITATYSMSNEDYKNITGQDANKNTVLFSASQSGMQLEPGKIKEIDLVLSTSTTENFVFKTLYYGGSDSKKAAGDYDQFFEIYNNSNKTLYADSLCIAITTMNRYGNGHPTQDKRYYYTEDGRYDWSKAEGMTLGEKANSDYYYASMLFMIPGNGKEHPVKPGESLVIARFATNFKSKYTNIRGTVVEVASPELTVDLSKADFEGAYERTKALTNPNVPDLILIHKGNNTSMRLSSNGKEGYVLFRHPSPSQLPIFVYPAIDPKKGSKSQFIQIPNANLIDAVEVISPTSTGYVSPKAIQKKDDAGYAYVKEGEYTSLALTRKISRMDGNRRVLQDINNSGIDFLTIKAEPRAFAPAK